MPRGEVPSMVADQASISGEVVAYAWQVSAQALREGPLDLSRQAPADSEDSQRFPDPSGFQCCRWAPVDRCGRYGQGD
jgi:hypothetical protein